MLRRRQVEAEVRRGERDAVPEDKTLNDLTDYWEDKRAVRKRSRKDDVSIHSNGAVLGVSCERDARRRT